MICLLEPTATRRHIYIGLDEVATKILTDLATRELIDETGITYSGETILEKIADSLSPTRIWALKACTLEHTLHRWIL